MTSTVRETIGLHRSLFLIYVLALCATHPAIRDPTSFAACLLAMIGLTWRELADRAAFWLLLTVTLALNLLVTYAHSANHYFLTIYVAAYLAMDALSRDRGWGSDAPVARGLLIVVFGFAALNKFRAYFVSGRLLAGYILTGHTLSNVLPWVDPGLGEVLDSYDDAFDDVADEALRGTASKLIEIPEYIITLSKGLAVGALAYELFVLASLISTRMFKHIAFPAIFLAFLWGTALLRHEYFFFTLLALLVLFAKPEMSRPWRTAFYASIAVFIAMGISELPLEL